MLRECMEYAVLFGKLSLTVAPAQDNTHTKKGKWIAQQPNAEGTACVADW